MQSARLLTRKLLSTALLAILSFNSLLGADAAKGEVLFTNNCTSCHKLGSTLIGPNLIGVDARWSDKAKLHSFIKNSQAVINTGDPYAKSLYDKYQVIMPAQQLNDAEIDDVLAYIATGGGGSKGGATMATAGMASAGSEGLGTGQDGFLGVPTELFAVLLVFLILLLLGVVYLLTRTRKQLAEAVHERERAQGQDDTPMVERQGEKLGRWVGKVRRNVNPAFVVATVVGLIVLLALLDMYDRAQDLGTQWGYAPEQPIKFNHKLHAGQYGIQCQYCHTGVEKGASASIPPLGTCMNCHNYINQGPQYGTSEVAKIYTALDYNPETRKYGDSAKPVEWVRIHNLPDHVYFNHAQHVKSGRVACETCHGKVQQMERVQQVATLEMGWCINCHRQTQINSDNPYYTNTFDFVKKHEKYTIAQLGGIECSKCHY